MINKYCVISILLALFAAFTLSAQIEFVENKGQWNEDVHFRTDLPGGVMWAEKNALTYIKVSEQLMDAMHTTERHDLEGSIAHVYKMNFVGGNAELSQGNMPSSHFLNYYIGNDESKWSSHVKPFQQGKLLQMYSGVDVLLHSSGGNLKYDLKIAPNSDPSQIRLQYQGLDSIYFRDGELVLNTSLGEVIEHEPYAFQWIEGAIREVNCSYRLEGEEVLFDLGEYDPNYILTIDPEISFATYIGSPASNFGFTAGDDVEGNMIAGAAVFAAGYPTTLGAIETTFDAVFDGYCDAAISKFNEDGSQLIYSTYLGGEGLEMPHSIVGDNEGNYIVMGTTGSHDFPITNGAFQTEMAGGLNFDFAGFFVNATHLESCDFFLAKFNSDDSGLLASTYVGGYGVDGLNVGEKLFYNYGDLFRGEVIVDEQNKVYVASCTNSTSFPMVGNSVQSVPSAGGNGVVFRMNSDLSELEYSTYLGGDDEDAAYSIQIDSSGSMIVCGGTKSSNFPMTQVSSFDNSHNGDVDAFILKFSDGSGVITASTFFGTQDYDQAYFIQLDLNDNVYIYGQSDGPFEMSDDVYGIPNSGQFISKFNNQLTVNDWTTTIGSGDGMIDISPTAFLVSDCDQIYISGWGGITNQFNSDYALSSTTTGLPITDNAYQSNTDGSDFYLCVLSPDATDLVYATYFGGDTSTEHVDGGTAKFDKDGSVFQAVCAGCGGNSDFPSTPGAWSDTNPSTNCNLGVFKFDLGKIHAQIDIDGPIEVCEGQPALFINNTEGGDAYEWSFGDENGSDLFEPTHVYEENGEFTIRLIVSDVNECLETDTAYLSILILPGVNPSVELIDPICEGEEVALFGEGSENAFWVDHPALSDPNIPNPVVLPIEPTTFYFVDVNDCESDTVPVFVDFIVPQVTTGGDLEMCVGESIELSATGAVSYVWSPSDVLNDPGIANPIATPIETTIFQVQMITSEGCEANAEQLVTVFDDNPGGLVYPTQQICIGEGVLLMAADGFEWSWSPEESLNNPNIQSPFASPVVNTNYMVEVTNICGTGIDEVTVEVITPEANAGDAGMICFGENHPAWASGGVDYQWEPSQYVGNNGSPNVFLSPPDNQVFTVYVSDEIGCTSTATVAVEVLPLPDVDAGADQAINWLESTYLQGQAEGIYWWLPEEGLNCTDCLNPLVYIQDAQWYILHEMDENGCVGKDSLFIDVYFPIYVPNSFTPNNDGINDLFRAMGDNIRGFHMEVTNRWGEQIFVSDDIAKGWNGNVHNGEYYAQMDIYIWTIWYDDLEGRQQLQGHVSLIR